MNDEKFYRETRIVKDVPFNHAAVEVFFYGDKVCSMTVAYDTVFAYIARDPAITAMHVYAFEAVWRSCGSAGSRHRKGA